MHVHVNAATSVDGKLSTVDREQVRISSPRDFDRVDALRADVDGVMVGIGTVLADDPSLTVDDEGLIDERIETGQDPQPTRIVADSRGRLPLDARLLDDEAETVVLVADAAPDDRRSKLTEAGATVRIAGDARVDLQAGLDALEAEGIRSILVEGGGELLYSFFEGGLVDSLSVYVGPMIIGGTDAPTLVDGAGFHDHESFPSLTRNDVKSLDEGVLIEWEVTEQHENPSQ